MKCFQCGGRGYTEEYREVNVLGLFPVWDELVRRTCTCCGGSGTILEGQQ